MDKTSATKRTSGRFSSRTSATIRKLRLTALFRPEDILHNPDDTAGDELPELLLQHLALEYGIGNMRSVLADVETNIQKDDPHVFPGVAVVHARPEKVDMPLIAMATSKNGTEFAGKTIHLLILVLTPPDMPGAYKQIFHAITKSCEKEDIGKHIASHASPLAVWQHFEAGGHRLPDHLQARHIMSEAKVFLNSDDNLARAIELFLANHLSELPVLTPDHELIGVVTTRRLVKVCMPDYLMWIEDMTPFLNFEPIADVIRNASSTWLKEIMVQDFAHVVETSPAIMALREIGRHETDNCYVTRGRVLVGVVYLHEFLNSVLQ